MKSLLAVAASIALLSAAGVSGVEAQTPELAPAAQLDDVVVQARRSGAPMWTVVSGDSSLILVGAITGIPRDPS